MPLLVFVCDSDLSGRQGGDYFFPSDGQGGAVRPFCGEGPGDYAKFITLEEAIAAGGGSMAGTTTGGSTGGGTTGGSTTGGTGGTAGTTAGTSETCCTAQQMELIGITPEGVGIALAFGMTCIATLWGIGYIGGALIRAINEA